MPELPEIAHLSQQMQLALTGKIISSIEVLQPKCLNLDPASFLSALTGTQIAHVSYHGKWLEIETNRGWLLLNLGMGGECLLVSRSSLPEKCRLVFDFTDAICLSINFWWFGYAHFVPIGHRNDHAMTASLGANAIEISLEDLKVMMKGQRGRIKPFLLDQSHIAEIANAYIHDILFLARLHPLRKIETLTESDISLLYQAIQEGLRPSLAKGGAFYELDLHGNKGGFTMDDILIGYKENQPCPTCRTPIIKIKTGSTPSFICPTCQPAP
jgi:formamidopyrimidine-DNA glycosylase